jgi:hypothetical protein
MQPMMMGVVETRTSPSHSSHQNLGVAGIDQFDRSRHPPIEILCGHIEPLPQRMFDTTVLTASFSGVRTSVVEALHVECPVVVAAHIVVVNSSNRTYQFSPQTREMAAALRRAAAAVLGSNPARCVLPAQIRLVLLRMTHDTEPQQHSGERTGFRVQMGPGGG